MAGRLQAEFVAHWEEWLDRYGDTTRGVGWPKDDANLRYQVMLDVVRPGPSAVTLLDFGCGASHLYEHLRGQRQGRISYSGLDLSSRFLEISRRKFPDVTYYDVDVLDAPSDALPAFDYVVMNGLFTYKGALPHDQMFDYLRQLLRRLIRHTGVGLAFNAMSTQVDWPRDDLFHLPIDPLMRFLSTEISRHVVIRHDYSLYEYTVYVYTTPTIGDPAVRRLVDGARPA